MSAPPRLNHFRSFGPHGFHRIAYTEWGDPRNPHIVICVHGLTRNSRDFDELAANLSETCRVVCMDVAGRGDSDWLEHKKDYGYTIYQSDAAALLARLTAPVVESQIDALVHKVIPPPARGPQRIDWIGTSMGGLIGMILAAKARSPIHRLVLNDVGPLVPWPALVRLKGVHSGANVRFTALEEVERHLRVSCATFGPLADRQWRHLAEHGSRRTEDGHYVLAFDPAIVSALRQGTNTGIEFGSDFLSGVDLWPMWDAVQCQTLVLRGADSDLLLPATVEQMKVRGPRVQVVEFPGIGHAPWLMSAEQIRVVREFILAPEATPAAD